MIEIQDVIKKIQAYHPNANIDLINKAYDYSAKAHDGQKRKSGHPYLIHPLEVADILADMHLDVDSIVSGILHDTIEDTQATKEEIEELFGHDIAEIVDGVTKLSKIHFNTQEDRQAESFRKMLIAMSHDIRVLLIKLADRLNNMRTLQFMREEKQMLIARETLEIYSPLANRLGIQWMKSELEDLSFRFLKPNIYSQIEKKLSGLRKIKEDYIDRVILAIQEQIKETKLKVNFSGRIKHIYSVYQKMERQEITFEQVNDIIAFRVITTNIESCYEILGILHSLWKPVPGRFKDYIAMPKPNNYQSLHTTVICLEGQRVEFQIRTEKMHHIAESGIAAHWEYKDDGSLDVKSKDTFNWLRELIDWENELDDSIEFMDTVKNDLFSSEIFIFTPNGDVKPLPFGATPIDFAYSIHSDVGHHCTGAKVNGQMVPLSYKLNSGDEVEIITSPHRHPSKDWLEIAISSRARARIRQYLKQEQRNKSVILGKKIFEQECRQFDISASKTLKSKKFKELLTKRSIADEKALYSSIAYGKIATKDLLEVIYPEKIKEKEEGKASDNIIKKIFKKVSMKNREIITVDGLDGILINFAKCCSPIPGDRIVGFITRGRGVTIHRVVCSKVPEVDTNRRVKASWNQEKDLTRLARITLTTINEPGMLAKISHSISQKKVNITKVVVRTTKDQKAVMFLNIDVSSVKELNAVMKDLQKIKGVIDVERNMGA